VGTSNCLGTTQINQNSINAEINNKMNSEYFRHPFGQKSLFLPVVGTIELVIVVFERLLYVLCTHAYFQDVEKQYAVTIALQV
jgi:hypothetical protein